MQLASPPHLGTSAIARLQHHRVRRHRKGLFPVVGHNGLIGMMMSAAFWLLGMPFSDSDPMSILSVSLTGNRRGLVCLIGSAGICRNKNARELEKASSTGVNTVLSDRPAKEGGARRTPSAAPCYRCGGKHPSDKCRFLDSDCHHCGKKGHLAKVYRTRQRENAAKSSRGRSTRPRPWNQTTHHVHESASDEEPGYDTNVLNIPGQRPSPLVVKVRLNEVELCMEVDTSASASIISEQTYERLWPEERPRLTPSSRKLRTYTGEELEVLGTLQVEITYGEQQKTLPLLVVAGAGPSLFGRDWLLEICLDWQHLGLYRLQAAPPTTVDLQSVLQRHEAVFRDELGLVKGVTAKLHIEPMAQPRFCMARTIPYALRDKVDQELERLEKSGVIKPVQFSD